MFRKMVSPASNWKLLQPVCRAKASSVDAGEVEKFSKCADYWWDHNGKLKGLHSLNAVRVPFIVEGLTAANRARLLRELSVLDVGCGAGILTERLAPETGAACTGIDPSAALVAAAHNHAQLAGGLDNLRYACTTVEEAVAAAPEAYDAVVASEVVEHVADRGAFVAACCGALRVGGSAIFTAINRTLSARVCAIWAAECVWNAIPRGTHDWRKFVTPRELADCLEENGWVSQGLFSKIVGHLVVEHREYQEGMFWSGHPVLAFSLQPKIIKLFRDKFFHDTLMKYYSKEFAHL